MFEGMAAEAMGEEYDWGSVVSAAKDILPLVPTEAISPMIEGFLSYKSNKDFWKNRDIWGGEPIELWKEVNNSTHPFYEAIADSNFNVSPARLQVLVNKMVAPNNTYTSVLGNGLKMAMGKLNEKERQQVIKEIVSTGLLYGRFIKETNPYVNVTKKAKEIDIKENTRWKVVTDEFDEIYDSFVDGGRKAADMSQLMSFLQKQRPRDMERLERRLEGLEHIQNIPDKRWWRSLIGYADEAKVAAVMERSKYLNKEEVAKMEGHLRQVPHLATERFEYLYEKDKKNK